MRATDHPEFPRCVAHGLAYDPDCRGCWMMSSWEEGYAAGLKAAEPRWTRVDLEDPSTWPEGWVRIGGRVELEGASIEVRPNVAVYRRFFANGRPVWFWEADHSACNGDWWLDIGALPAPPKEEP